MQTTVAHSAPATPAEIKLAVHAAIARHLVNELHKEYTKLASGKKKYLTERRRLATIRTYITDVAALILAQGTLKARKTAVREAERQLKSVRDYRLIIDWGEELPPEPLKWFSNYGAIYCTLRDIIVYYERHEDRLDGPTKDFENARKELLKRSRSALSALENLFLEEVESGLSTSWSKIKSQLMTEEKPYQFQARMVVI